MFGSDEYLIQFCLFLYPMLLIPQNPFEAPWLGILAIVLIPWHSSLHTEEPEKFKSLRAYKGHIDHWRSHAGFYSCGPFRHFPLPPHNIQIEASPGCSFQFFNIITMVYNLHLSSLINHKSNRVCKSLMISFSIPGGINYIRLSLYLINMFNTSAIPTDLMCTCALLYLWITIGWLAHYYVWAQLFQSPDEMNHIRTSFFPETK